MDCHLDNTVLEAEAQHAEFFVNINTPVEKQECSLIGNVSGWLGDLGTIFGLTSEQYISFNS